MADFIELSQVSLRKYRYSLGSVDTERYKNTLYVAISENNQVSCAYNPVILKEAYQCILIHCKSKIAVTNWYNWYKVEFINHNGINLGEIIGNDCHLKISCGAGGHPRSHQHRGSKRQPRKPDRSRHSPERKDSKNY